MQRANHLLRMSKKFCSSSRFFYVIWYLLTIIGISTLIVTISGARRFLIATPDREIKSESDDEQIELKEEIIDPEDTSEEINPIPNKSGQIYQSRYNRFMEWCYKRGVVDYTEKTLLEYFSDMRTKQKMKSSSMWNHYSIMKLLLHKKHGVDISHYTKLRAYLKQQGLGYKPKKARALTKEDFHRFLLEAPDEKYLAMKVVMIIGISGGCLRDELLNLTIDNVQDMKSFIYITIPDSFSKKTRHFKVSGSNYVQLFRKYVALRPLNVSTRRFFLKYLDGKCFAQGMGVNKIGSVPKIIACFLKLPNWKEYTGHSFRRTCSFFLEEKRRQMEGLL